MNQSNSLDNLLKNMEEIDALMAFYQKAKDEPVANQVNSHHSPYILLKSNLIFIVTCWEEYIKSLVDESFTFMLDHSSNIEIFPEHVRRTTAEILPQESNLKNKEMWHHEKWKTDVWKLVDEWREFLTKNKRQRVEKFQSSRKDNINTLFFQTIGLKGLSDSWIWQGMSNEEAIKCLNTLLDLRGDYVHKNRSYRLISETDIEYFPKLIEALAGISANKVRDYIYDKVGYYPWLYNKISPNALNFDSKRCTER
ncbi:hypothetical protein PN36_06790 [Candidatus Thiomargarita nelsonii]|uniref:RiboL-PSP-HEPN domain-containing protein n=1 Tax=Candidatus Thiomargarita nelsonii TaxID=1003181 RepID=A0A0A6RQ12_9GAMM|nr:hypothetical protein PN36_06790 [Candidatus Thiomargarita nelsonii]